MRCRRVSEKDGLVCVACDGPIAPLPGDDPLLSLLGPVGFQRTVLLDLGPCHYINSAGLNWLLICNKHFRECGGRLVVHSLQPPVRKVVRFVGLHKVLELTDDEELARALAAGAAAGVAPEGNNRARRAAGPDLSHVQGLEPGGSPMQLKMVADEGDVVRVAVEGQISQLVSQGNEPMVNLLGPAGFGRKVLLNLEKATFINSSGISWLLICHKYFTQCGGKLIVHSVPPLVNQVLQFVRLPSIMTFAEDEARARALVREEKA